MTDGTYPATTVRAAWIAVLGTVLVGPVLIRLVTGPPAALWTQLSTTTGLLALSATVCAAVLPSRVRSLTRAFGIEGILEVHRSLGALAAALVLAHLACVVAADPANVALLDPARATTASVAATVATLAVALVVVLAITRGHTRHLSYELWRWTHVALAAVGIAGSALHVWYLQQLVTDSVMSAVLALLTVALLAVLLHRWLLRALFDPSSEFVVREVRPESASVSTLVLDRRRAQHGDDPTAEWTFAPGQFAWLRLARSTRAQEHPFTIASSAHDPDAVEFTIRHAGSFSTSVARLTPGQPVWVDGPHGAFTVDDSRSATGVVMIAGGVGVTPMMSMLRTAADRGDARRFHLVLVVARREDVLFRDELALLGEHLYLDVSEVLRSRERGSDVAPLATALAEAADAPIHGPGALDYFVCGSPTLVETAFHALELLGVPPDHVRTEQFDPV